MKTEKFTPISFDEILLIWKSHLWPNRQDAIEPVSAMLLGGGIDISIQKYEPTFLGYKLNNELVAAISGVQTGKGIFRIRGLVVAPELRQKGIGREITLALMRRALEQGFRLFWTAPRQNNLGFYQKIGFVQVSDWTKTLFVPGPNCYAAKCVTEEETQAWFSTRST